MPTPTPPDFCPGIAASATGPQHRLVVFGLVLAALLLCAFIAGPYLHALTTQAFADNRSLLGVPNFENVASNLAFLLVGLGGLALCAGSQRPRALAAWRAFYLGMVLTGAGSVWYHLAPSDATIVFDRLGMTVAFAGLAIAILEESTHLSLTRLTLVPALLLGAASVLWWRASGDLRPYAWVQAAPLACIATSVLLGWVPAPMRRALVFGFALYLLAKVVEMFDARIFDLTRHIVSGHTLKHLLAAAATSVVLLLQWQQLRARSSHSAGSASC